jgi:hypothetical protein
MMAAMIATKSDGSTCRPYYVGIDRLEVARLLRKHLPHAQPPVPR